MGTADIIVCDGFTGNIALKIIEGAAEFFTLLLKEELGKGLAGMAGALLARGAFKRFKKLVDYTEYGARHCWGAEGSVSSATPLDGQGHQECDPSGRRMCREQGDRAYYRRDRGQLVPFQRVAANRRQEFCNELSLFLASSC